MTQTTHPGDDGMRHGVGHDASAGAYTVALAVLLGATVLVAAVTFVLSFHGLTDYGQRVAGIEGRLAWLIPLGVDGLTLCAVAATFLLRHAELRVRAYAWLVFGVAVAASVAGNLSHAASRRLTSDGMVGAAAWPILLALASHLVIVSRRAMERQGAATSPGTAPTAPPPASHRDVAPAPSAPPTAAEATETASPPAARRTPARRRTATAKPDDARSEARRRYADGDKVAEIVLALKVSRKTVERWTSDLRQQREVSQSRDASTEQADDDKERVA